MSGPGDVPQGEQLSLVPEQRPRRRPAGTPASVDLPVARVVVDTPLPHLDRPFEYAVPEDLAQRALPGVRVRVRLAGRDHDGFVLERTDRAEHAGPLSPLRRVVGDEPVLTPHTAAVCRAVADHYGGAMADVLRLAVPPRHARVEAEVVVAPGDAGVAPVEGTAWADHPAGPAFLRRLSAGESPSAAWTALPGRTGTQDWPFALAEAAAATLSSGRGSVVVVPDHRDVDRVCAAVDALLGPGRHARLTADLGPGERYRAWLSVLRGHQRIVVGTRAAAYAPVHDPGLLAVWDDGDDLLREPRTPYPHIREVLRTRAEHAGAALLLGGFVRSPEVQLWVDQGRVKPVAPHHRSVRDSAPRVLVAGEGVEAERDAAAARARIPSLAWRTVHDALERGPVLVQVPRRGYAVGLSCARCRHPLRCTHCGGPSVVDGPERRAACQWCGQGVPDVPCPECGATGRRPAVVGDQRTAEEIGRAFPGVPVRSSRAGHVLPEVGDTPAVVVATPGAEPVAAGGYAATLLLDGWALLDRPGLDTTEEAVRRWAGAAALTRPSAAGGQVVVVGVPPHGHVRPVEALVRWDPEWFVAQEVADRALLRLPPVRRAAVVSGDADAVTDWASGVVTDPDLSALEVLGPVPVTGRGGHDRPGDEPQVQVVVRGRAGSDAMVCDDLVVEAVRRLRRGRSAHKATGHVVAVVDPPDLLA
jgi:primosomal protein N' (replication factor Y) (superfamily II helicase)